MKLLSLSAAVLVSGVFTQGAFAATLSGDYAVKSCAPHYEESANPHEVLAGIAVSAPVLVASPVKAGTLVHIEALNTGLWVSAISLDGSSVFTPNTPGIANFSTPVRSRGLNQFYPVIDHVNAGHFFQDAHFNADKTAFSAAITLIKFDGSEEGKVVESNVLELTAGGAKGFIGDQSCELVRR